LPVVIEVDIGMKRAGVLPGAPAVELAKLISATPGLRFEGLMAWEGHATRIADPIEKKRAVEDAVGALVATAGQIRAAGLPVAIVSCGGTGTYALTAAIPGVTELQVGGGVFSDVVYRKLFHVEHPYALTLLSTVSSRPNPRRIVCDAGKKSMSGDMALPEPIGVAGVASVRLSAEHATIELDRDDTAIRVGDKLEFVVGYSDTTVHLHDELYAVRGGRVEDLWRIVARGKTR
jgi:D-serine deaminase-like pyridoxal phosphate-dependent protein